MNKEIPSINKIIQFYDFKRNWEMHESKIRNVKPTLTTRLVNQTKINICLNKTAKQPFGNSFNRTIDIQFQNKALLKKLTDKNKPNPKSSNLTTFRNPWNEQNYKLVKNNRKRYFEEHQRRLQNEGLLKRIKETKPLYQMQKFMTQRKTTEKYINTISKFGYKDYKPNKTILKFQMLKKIGQKQNIQDRNIQHNQTYHEDTQSGRQVRVKRIIELKRTKQFTFKGYKSLDKLSHLHINQGKENSKKLQNINQNDLNFYKSNLKNQKRVKPNLQNNSSVRLKSQRNSRDNSPSKLQNSAVFNLIPEKLIKIKGRSFSIEGKQFLNKIRLEILDIKSKSIGNDYIHEVQISNEVYIKKYHARIDILIENLKFDKIHQSFYLS